jgi:hypothetical protein
MDDAFRRWREAQGKLKELEQRLLVAQGSAPSARRDDPIEVERWVAEARRGVDDALRDCLSEIRHLANKHRSFRLRSRTSTSDIDATASGPG